MPQFQFDGSHLRSSWNPTRMMMRGKLTDRKIDKYSKLGWYSDAFKEARRDLMAKKKAKSQKRSGSFLEQDGRMIYSPL